MTDPKPQPTHRNDDGSYSPAVPLGWQGSGIDWEIYKLADGTYEAHGYDEDMLLHVVMAVTREDLDREIQRIQTQEPS